MMKFVKMTFWEKNKLETSLYTRIIALYKKGTGMVFKPVTVCNNKCCSVENTFVQSVPFGRKRRAPAQAYLP